MSKAPFWGAEYVFVQSLSVIQLYNLLQSLYNPKIPYNSLQWTVAQQASLSFTIS